MPKWKLNLKDPSVRAMIIDDYDKHGIEYVHERYGVAGSVVREWKRLRSEFGSLETRYSHQVHETKLTRKEIKKLEQKLLDDPYATNEELAAVVGNKITPRSAGNYIERSELNFVWKLEQEDIEASFSPRVFDEGRKFMNRIKNTPQGDRVYVDETEVTVKVRRRSGRFPSHVAPWTPKNRFYRHHTAICAITTEGWLHPAQIYEEGSISTVQFVDYVRDVLCPLLGPGKKVLWDRWGRSGRAKNPVAHHFSPEARELIEATGATLELLPPAGKLFDPIEPVFGDTKRIFEKKLGKKLKNRMPSEVPLRELEQLWHAAEEEIRPDSFKRAFKQRASGKEFLRVSREKGLID